MKPPSFQFYADDFLGGTIAMNFAERGLYITLLCIQWSQGFVTQDDINGVVMAQPLPEDSLAKVLRKFDLCKSDAKFRNKRMEIERRKQTAYLKSCSNRGKAGASARWLKHSSSNTKAMPKNGSPYSVLRTPKERKKKGGFEIPTIEQVRLLCQKAGLPELEADKLFYHYDSKGWKVGQEPMRSLPSAIGGWAARWRSQNGQSHTQTHFPVGE